MISLVGWLPSSQDNLLADILKAYGTQESSSLAKNTTSEVVSVMTLLAELPLVSLTNFSLSTRITCQSYGPWLH
jgi:hypothetical protein